MAPRLISSLFLSSTHHSSNPLSVPCILTTMKDCPFRISPKTSADECEIPSRGLLDQRVFFFDQVGSERLANQHATILIDAIAIAHRLFFSSKSLRILDAYLNHALASEMMWRKGWEIGFQPHIAPALDEFAVRDGMYVILDRKTHQDGFVRIGEPRSLRISATLVEEAIKAARKSTTIYHTHLFYLASVLAHLICRSIRLTIAGTGHIGDWTWEDRYFGGFIERILSPNPYARGEIVSLVVASHDKSNDAYLVLSPGILRNLIEGQEGWEVHLPLRAPVSRWVRGRHRDQVRFQESRREEETHEVDCYLRSGVFR